MTIFHNKQTSAALLERWAAQKWGPDSQDSSDVNQRRYLLIYDIYIKASSYSIINKVAFWLAIIGGMAVLIWPSLAVLAEDFGWQMAFLQSAMVQTTVTGLAVLMFGLYSHYKKRQSAAENLMRQLIYGDYQSQEALEQVLTEMERLDGGFGFAQHITTKDKEKP
ncbi:hypothetical protein P2G88_18385 [Aliiglaciecola sp. CAU 1673]|uniref:hypothetical protein n=1 Tax=Aliiglaciecola sp. CAU 1673 TaxID=3032595 RepID=UPI0023DAD804|nr:hypothetical protein [Aliiglaciecola sp. CAU 1673]MDF2180228.1 hypothetical protein [Aliiglaciecola sp. CAU 1673]